MSEVDIVFLISFLIGLFICGIVFPIVCGNVAKKKGRSWWGWFFLSMLITPMMALLLLVSLGDKESK